MVAVANLRIEVDTSKLRATVSELDKLASKGERTESALQMTSKINMSGAAQVARQMDNLASKARATDTAADMIAQVSSSGFQVVSRQMDALKNKAIATDRFMDMTSTIKTPGWNLVSRQMDNIATRAKAARTQMTGLAGAGRQAGAALRPMAGVATKTGTAMKTSGAHTANLAAQFNDIGVMLAAGQSPLLLAMQQGTQVSQVFTQMGVKGKGALRALGGAFTAFLGPTQIATVAIIAGGAALIQWAIGAVSADGAAGDLESQLEDLGTAVKEYGSALKTANEGADWDKYGQYAEQVNMMQVAYSKLKAAVVDQKMSEALKIEAEGWGGWLRTLTGLTTKAQEFFNLQSTGVHARMERFMGGDAPSFQGQRMTEELEKQLVISISLQTQDENNDLRRQRRPTGSPKN